MKLFGYYINILISKQPISIKKVKWLKEGSAHIRKNPKKKEKGQCMSSDLQ